MKYNSLYETNLLIAMLGRKDDIESRLTKDFKAEFKDLQAISVTKHSISIITSIINLRYTFDTHSTSICEIELFDSIENNDIETAFVDFVSKKFEAASHSKKAIAILKEILEDTPKAKASGRL